MAFFSSTNRSHSKNGIRLSNYVNKNHCGDFLFAKSILLNPRQSQIHDDQNKKIVALREVTLEQAFVGEMIHFSGILRDRVSVY